MSQHTDQFGEPRVVGHLSLQQRQVGPQEGHDERPQRVVGGLLQRAVKLLDRQRTVLRTQRSPGQVRAVTNLSKEGGFVIGHRATNVNGAGV